MAPAAGPVLYSADAHLPCRAAATSTQIALALAAFTDAQPGGLISTAHSTRHLLGLTTLELLEKYLYLYLEKYLLHRY